MPKRMAKEYEHVIGRSYLWSLREKNARFCSLGRITNDKSEGMWPFVIEEKKIILDEEEKTLLYARFHFESGMLRARNSFLILYNEIGTRYIAGKREIKKKKEECGRAREREREALSGIFER